MLRLPLFFPDATQAVVKTVDAYDIKATKTPGILVNTYHLYNKVGKQVIRKHGGVRQFMGWTKAIISDSGGFQIMSLAKKNNKGKITDKGVIFQESGDKKVLFTPEDSIRYQMLLKTDLLVVLDDFTEPRASYKKAHETVERTINWAQRSKKEFEKICQRQKLSEKKRPYLIAVVQGGKFLDLRQKCGRELVKIGFDGLGFGGWPITDDGEFNYEVAKLIADLAPHNYLLYGLGIGRPEEIVGCVRLGYHIFDCVLPTRDARHRRLYVFNAPSLSKIDVTKPNFYSYYVPDKEIHTQEKIPVSEICDCHLCQNYSRAYLAHLFRIKELTAQRLATIHNLRFFSLLMGKLRD